MVGTYASLPQYWCILVYWNSSVVRSLALLVSTNEAAEEPGVGSARSSMSENSGEGVRVRV